MSKRSEHLSDIILHQIQGSPLPLIKRTSSNEPILLGRSRECSHKLASKDVSPTHTMLKFKAGRWLMKDLQSLTGTYLNTIRMESGEVVEIKQDDLLQIGPWKFLIIIDHPSENLDQAIVTEIDNTPLPEKGEVPVLVRTVDGRYETNADLLLQLKSDHAMNKELGWSIFFDRYGPIICGFARNAGLPSSDADDIMQTVLFSFFKVADKFEYDPNKGRFRGYLKRITLNAIRHRYRKNHESRLGDLGINDTEDPRDDLGDAFDQEWVEHLLTIAMNVARPKFEPKTWEAFDLFGRRGLSASQTGKHLGMTSEAVRHAKSRVMRSVREIVTRLREDEL